MKTLGLFRHAKSDWGASDKRDYDRGLNARGRRGAQLMGTHIRDHGVAWDILLASPAERVRLTLEEARIGIAPEWDKQLYLAGTDTILEILREQGGSGDKAMIAGHNPGLGDMILELVAPEAENALFDEAKVKFPTAAFAVLELDIEDWSDIAPGSGRLVHFARPRDLDAALGPETAPD
ncbi:SixA phosphatase family protein [Qipengyuania sp. MTN3-11]|uniref:SixA phosphatase family protein n=1 Tax=Qipengyuania sp. MTN3-11 TaxID=3056557 RepID=UPI0036F38BF0